MPANGNVAIGEFSHCFGNREAAQRHVEINHRAAYATAEAVKDLLLSVDLEARSALVVQRAQADPFVALAAESSKPSFSQYSMSG